MTTSAIRRRYGWGAARLCIEAQPVRYEKTPPLLPNATSGAATVLIGGLAVFALLRSIEPPDETPSEIQIVQLQEVQPEPPPPEPEPVLQPLPEPEPPPPEPKPEPVVVAKAEPPPPKPEPVRHKPAPARRVEPPKPKPEPVRVAPEPEPMWKRAPITPPAPRPEPPAPARRPPPVQIEAPKPVPEVVEAPPAPAWKPVAIAQKAPPPKVAAPHVAIDAVNVPSSAPPESPTRATSLPPGVPSSTKPAPKMPTMRPVVPAAAAPDFAADSAPSPMVARNSVPTPVAPTVTKRPPPKGGLAMPGISTARDTEPPAAMDTRGYQRPGVTAPPAPAARSEPNAKLRGVPLGSLAACRTDRLEDDLKQKVLAAVRNREECESPAGRYRFVETKNLNAFLMWIERAPGRAEGDRCAELSFALSCLRGGAR